jgi:hypothetical protein
VLVVDSVMLFRAASIYDLLYTSALIVKEVEPLLTKLKVQLLLYLLNILARKERKCTSKITCD